jgi:hypothetical protein
VRFDQDFQRPTAPEVIFPAPPETKIVPVQC